MIRWKDVKLEINKLNEKAKAGEKLTNADVVKAVDLVLKMVRDIRGNQVLIMKALKIDLRKPETREERTEEKTEEKAKDSVKE